MLSLLEAVGHRTKESLAAADPSMLHGELLRANEMLRLVDAPPDLPTLHAWIAEARGSHAADHGAAADPRALVDHEADPLVRERISGAPVLVALPSKSLASQGIRVGEIPEGLLLNRYPGALVLDEPAGPEGALDDGSPDGDPKTPGLLASGAPLSVRRIGESGDLSPVPAAHHAVVHRHPLRVYSAAFSTALFLIALPLGIVGSGLLVASRVNPDQFHWVPSWLVWFPAGSAFLALPWALCAVPVRCVMCLQRAFVPSSRSYHQQAHRFPGLGSVLPLSLSVLFRLRYRCNHCATRLALRKPK